MPTGSLLERAPQLTLLHACLQSARSDAGRMVFAGGEAGIGKTSLVQAFCGDAAAQARVLMGGCDAMETPRPLGPLFDIANEVGESFVAALEGEDRGPIFDILLRELRTPRMTTVLVLEDVHWADDATLDLLRFLGRRIGTTPSLVIATYRDDEVGPRHPLRTVIGDLATSAAVQRLTVPSLSTEAVGRLLRDAGITASDQAEALHSTTGGNPFFVTELLAARGHDMPATIQDAVLARAGRLPEPARDVLAIASILGAQVDPSLLAALGAEVHAIESCVSAGMLQESGQQLSFRHDLARTAIELALSVPRRRELHGLILGALEGTVARQSDLATLAHHAAESGDVRAILRIVPAAARQAARLGAHTEARTHYARTLPYLDQLTAIEHVQLLEAYATECSICDRLEESARVRREVVDRWRVLGRPDRMGVNLSILAQVFTGLGRNAEAETTNAEAVEVLQPLGPTPELARAYRYQANLRMQDRDTDAAIAVGKRAIGLARSVGDVAMAGNAHVVVGMAMLLADQVEGRAHIAEALSIADRMRLPYLLTNVRLNLGSVAATWYRFDEAYAELTTAIELAEQHDHDFQRLFSLATLALVHMHRGDWSAASDAALHVIERPKVSTSARLVALLALARLRVRRGDPEADALLDEALELATRTGNAHRVASVRAARAEAAALAGDGDRVRLEATDAYLLAVERRQPWFVGELGYWLWTVGAVDALPDVAAEPYALQATGRSREAALAWQQLGCPYEAARASAERGHESELRSALETFTELGARPAAALAARSLRELGVRNIPRGPRPTTREHAAHLTPREVEVLAAIAQGLRNAEIAQRHVVSTRTVDHQVSSILAKLDVRSRLDAVARAHQLGLLPQHRQDTDSA